MPPELSLGTYKGQQAAIAENETIKATVLPELGAKIASLIYKPQNFEVFFQPPAGVYPRPGYGADFSLSDTSGADEMFPTIDACGYPDPENPGIICPDHGELWSVPWQAEIDSDRGCLSTEAKGVALNYSFRRTLTLKENRLRLEYAITNGEERPLLALWAFHGLTACDELTRVSLPKARQGRTGQVLNVKDDDMLGEPGGVFDFPTHQLPDKAAALDRVRPQAVKLTRKYYVSGPVDQGQCALTLNRGRLEYRLAFPEKEVPYLGVWINEGGYKNEYNCALEPTTGFYDSLELAKKNQSLIALAPRETRRWWMEIVLRDIS